MVLGITLAGTAVLQRIAESVYLHGISQAKMPSIERRLARFVANERIVVSEVWKPFLERVLPYWQGKSVRLVLACGHLVHKARQQWFGRVLSWQEGTLDTCLSAVWDDDQREAWFLISDQPAGRQRVQQYAWRMRVEATFEDAKSRGS